MAAPLIRVETASDPRLHAYVGLTDLALRTRREPAEGLFIAEGEKVIRRAVDAGYPVRSLLLAEKWLPSVRSVIATSDAPVYLAPDALLEELNGFAVHRGALAEMGARAFYETVIKRGEDVLARARRVVVLEDVNNHTNIGAVFRAAAALGMDAVLVNPRCADPLYRRAVKVSMGTVFSVPWARLPAGTDGVELLRRHGMTVVALTPDPDALPLPELRAARMPRLALALGAEGAGLSAAVLAAADLRVRIPMAAGVDSLNIAAAAAIACYAIGPAATAGPAPSPVPVAASVPDTGHQRPDQGTEEAADHP